MVGMNLVFGWMNTLNCCASANFVQTFPPKAYCQHDGPFSQCCIARVDLLKRHKQLADLKIRKHITRRTHISGKGQNNISPTSL